MPVLLFTWKSTAAAAFFAGTNEAAVFPLNFYSSETLQLAGRDTSRSLSSSATFSVPAGAPASFYGVSALAQISDAMAFFVPTEAAPTFYGVSALAQISDVMAFSVPPPPSTIIGGVTGTNSLASSVNFSAY